MAFFGGVGVPIAAVLLLSLSAAASAQLSATFYDTSCPSALATIKSAVTAAVNNEPRMGASLLRLHFHDCFVQGCDASVLLNDTATFTGEQTAFPNRGSIRGFGVIDTAKAQVEAVCPQTVSCADILAVAARDSVVALGGPSYTVPLGRRDSTTASLSEANSDLPPPTSDLADLVGNFSRKGLSVTDMVALSGAHTIGQAECGNFKSRIYGESNIDAAFAAARQANCPQSGADDNLAPLDVSTPDAFDNAYYGNFGLSAGAPPLRPAAIQRRLHRRPCQHLRVQRCAVQRRLRRGRREHGQHRRAHGRAGGDPAHLFPSELSETPRG